MGDTGVYLSFATDVGLAGNLTSRVGNAPGYGRNGRSSP